MTPASLLRLRIHNLTALPSSVQVKGRITLVVPFGLFQSGPDVADDERLLIVHHQLLKACRSVGLDMGGGVAGHPHMRP